MKYIKNFGEHKINEAITGTNRMILALMDSTIEGRDLKAIIKGHTIRPKIGDFVIHSDSTNITISYNPSMKSTPWKYEGKAGKAHGSYYEHFATLEELFRALWVKLLKKDSSMPFIEGVGSVRVRKDYGVWLNENVAGKELSVTEIARKWLLEKQGIYHPNGSEFVGEPWDRMKRTLGLDFPDFDPSSQKDKCGQDIDVFLRIYDGELAPVFLALAKLYGADPLRFPHLKYETVLTSSDLDPSWGSATYVKFDIKESSATEYVEAFKKSIIYVFSSLPWDLHSLDLVTDVTPMRKIIIGEILGEDLSEIFKDVYKEIKQHPNSLSALADIKNNAPNVWAIMLGNSEEEKEIGNIGADLGGYGF